MTFLTQNIQRKAGIACLLLLTVVCLSVLPAMGQSAEQSQAILDKVNKIPGLSNIKHVVFIVKENRSFDNMFSHWNDAGLNHTPANVATQGQLSTGQILPLQDLPDAVSHDICHGWGCFILAIDNGKMDGFDLQIVGAP